MNKIEALKKYFGYDDFRTNQEEIIDSLLESKDTIAILPTGGGKSVCFQIPALLKIGLTIVITPLISLMHNQVQELKKRRIKAEYITSELEYFEIQNIIKKVILKEIKILYISPERLENTSFCEQFKSIEINYIIIDEAHCISIWGNDFRPSYQSIKEFINKLSNRPTIGAFTATANKKVINDISNVLELKNENIFKSSFDRKNLFYQVTYTKHKLSYITKFLLKHDEVGIIYTITRKDAEMLFLKLSGLGFNVGIYHGGMESDEKEKNLINFMKEEVKIMIATNAFGMGINKPNIRFVINYCIPISLEDLSQQQGRCSRDGKEGLCVLLYDSEDIKTCEYFIKKTNCTNKKLKAELIKEKYKQLKSVIDYANTEKCYRHLLLSYFGENSKVRCYNCSNCLKKKNKRNISKPIT